MQQHVSRVRRAWRQGRSLAGALRSANALQQQLVMMRLFFTYKKLFTSFGGTPDR
jgi:hypothetical protein